MKHGRKNLLSLTATAAVVCAISTACAAAAPSPGLTVKCVALKAVDGDTIDVEIRIPVRVRLLDCWAPELKDKDPQERTKAEVSKEAMEAAIAGNPECVLYIPTQDARSFSDIFTFGRVLGQVWVEDFEESLGQMQVRVGNASTRKGGKLGD